MSTESGQAQGEGQVAGHLSRLLHRMASRDLRERKAPGQLDSRQDRSGLGLGEPEPDQGVEAQGVKAGEPARLLEHPLCEKLGVSPLVPVGQTQDQELQVCEGGGSVRRQPLSGALAARLLKGAGWPVVSGSVGSGPPHGRLGLVRANEARSQARLLPASA